MKLIEPSAELLIQEIPVRKLSDNDGSYKLRILDGIYKQIELAGRTCYKSNDKITDVSAEPFVDRMIASKHYAMLEHGTVYLQIPRSCDEECNCYVDNPYSKTRFTDEYCYVTTNLRVIKENRWDEDLHFICNPTSYHCRRFTFKFVCDIGVQREFCRHRVFSFANESTRYCNYSKDKFDNEVTFIKPCWLSADNYEGLTEDERIYWRSLEHAEFDYLRLLEKGWKAEQARDVLPLSTKSELIMTGFLEDWKHFIDLRSKGTTGKPHPQAKELADEVRELLTEYINN